MSETNLARKYWPQYCATEIGESFTVETALPHLLDRIDKNEAAKRWWMLQTLDGVKAIPQASKLWVCGRYKLAGFEVDQLFERVWRHFHPGEMHDPR